MPKQQIMLSAVLAAMMFSVALDIRWQDFRAVARKPLPILCGLFAQFVLLPVATWLVTLLVNLPPAIECAIIKVAGTETLFYCADENVQIHGGNGFTMDYPAEGVYRDCRVNRIYEGTNEINRLLIPGQLIKRAMKGGLPLFAAAMKLQEELLAGPSFDTDEDDTPLANERKLAANAKKVALALIGSAAQKFQAALSEQQMILCWTADVIIEAFQLDSAIGRTAKLIARDGADKHQAAIDATRLYTHDAILRIEVAGKNALAAISEGDELRMMLVALKRFTKMEPLNTAAIRERLADKVVAMGGYIF